jgi:hypothetical protein
VGMSGLQVSLPCRQACLSGGCSEAEGDCCLPFLPACSLTIAWLREGPNVPPPLSEPSLPRLPARSGRPTPRLLHSLGATSVSRLRMAALIAGSKC